MKQAGSQQDMRETLAGAALVGFNATVDEAVAQATSSKSGKLETQIKASVAKSGKAASGKLARN